MAMNLLITFMGILTSFCFQPMLKAQSTRIKDLANVRGIRDNQLTGFGLVIGLAATGDSPASLATNEAIANMLTRMGMKTNPAQPTMPSIAAVVVTAELPAFKRNGDRLDVKVSVIGDAKSLAGGTLISTPLKAGDGNVYVIAQGAVVVGQARGAGPQVLTTATVPSGGSVEREFQPVLAPKGFLTLSLRNPDSTTSSRVADKINDHFKGYYAKSVDPSSVEVQVPPLYEDRTMEFLADMEVLKVDADNRAVVVLNERTGTVVMGADVVIGRVAISHGDLAIRVGDGKKDKNAPPETLVNLGGATVGSLVETLNALGIKPADLIGILQAVHAAGAIQAQLKFM